MSKFESAEFWDSISSELRQSLADSGVYLPGSEEWTRISDDLVPSTTFNHIFNIITIPAAETSSETFANFALEVVQSISQTDFHKYFRYEQFQKLTDAESRQLLKRWLRRWRIFRFDEKVTDKDLSILRGLTDERTPLPFIDVLWHQGRIIDISIREILEVDAWERTQRTALVSVGLELLTIPRNKAKTTNLITALMTATIKKQWGGARRKAKDFTPEMCERFAQKVNELQPLWDTITHFFEREEYDPNCIAMVQKHSEFQKHAALCTSKIPRSLLKRVFKRKNERGEEFWPSSFAILHAMLELKITGEYAISTLHKYHRKGNKLLRRRVQPSVPPKR